jgi:hypothetical protein
MLSPPRPLHYLPPALCMPSEAGGCVFVKGVVVLTVSALKWPAGRCTALGSKIIQEPVGWGRGVPAAPRRREKRGCCAAVIALVDMHSGESGHTV